VRCALPTRPTQAGVCWSSVGALEGRPEEQRRLRPPSLLLSTRKDPETRAYLQRKEAEGKTRMEAMRCLKRHLARRYYRLLSDRSRHRIEHQVYPGVP
jgi:hypothetical protein